MCQEYIDYSWLLHLHTNDTTFKIILSISNSKNVEKIMNFDWKHFECIG